MNFSLNTLRWLVAILVIAFLFVFEYVRHFVWPQFLHNQLAYFISLAIVFAMLLLFNENVFRVIDRMHETFVKQSNHLNTLIENSGHAIITTDLAGKILSWNRGAETIYGWTKDEAIGQFLPMVPPHLRDEAKVLLSHILQTKEPLCNFETLRIQKGGDMIPVMVTVSPIKDAEGKITWLLGISTDMRERKRLEQELLRQQRANAVLQERERLARELHDGLGQILGYVNTQSQAIRELLANNHTETADGYLKRLIEVAQDAHADVREYILGLHTKPSPDQKFVPVLRGYLQRFGQQNGIETALSAADELDALEFDPTVETQLLRIVQEALTNVRKHSRARRANIDIRLSEGMIQIQVSDDGTGFDTLRLTHDDGRHFGQRIMQERALEIGGKVEVNSVPGRGTQVNIRVAARKEGINLG